MLIGSINNSDAGNKRTAASTASGFGCNQHVKLAPRDISQNKSRLRPEDGGCQVEAFH
jgi:hypothetical protein